MRGFCLKIFPVFTVLLILSGSILQGQNIPGKLLSIPVYNHMVLNPGYVGSKDFTNISLTTKAWKQPDSQLLNFHKRIKNADGSYSKVGMGAYVFQEQYNESWNSGFALSGAYHLALDKDQIHNLSAGLTMKGIFAVPKTGEENVVDSLTGKFIPNIDLGIYYYGPAGFAGLSTTSVFGSQNNEDSTLNYAHLDRSYHLYGGYKFQVSKKLGIVIEPSVLLSLSDNTISEPHKHLVPYLKVYLENFYLGSYLKDFDVLALFFQYQFPKFYTGIFLEFPRVGYRNDDNIIFELSLGMNLGSSGSSFLQYRHW